VPALVACGLGIFVGVALAMLAAVGGGVYFWIEGGKTESTRYLEGVSNVIAHDFASRVESLQRHLRDWASEPESYEGLATASPADLRAKEEALARRIPDAQQVHLVKVGVDVFDAQRESLSYAGLDLIKQAEQSRHVTQLEVHKLGIPGEHLAIAAPVIPAGSDQVTGVVHVALPTTLLPAVQNAGGDSGRIGFQQTVGHQSVTLESAGQPPLPTRLPDGQVPVAGTSLRVAAWVGAQATTLDQDLLLRAGLAYLVLLALVLPAILVPILFLRRALVLDLTTIVALVDDLVNKKPQRAHQCRLTETVPAMEALAGLLRGVAGGGRIEPEAEPAVAAGEEAEAPPPAPPEPEPAAKQAPEPLPRARPTEAGLASDSVPAHIFRAYDIRGIVGKDLTPELMTAIGRAVGTEAGEVGDRSVIVGRDTRPTSAALCESLVAGLRKSGRDVLDLGVVPAPLVYFATRYQGETSGVMVTGSHNPAEYNGLKVVIGGATLAGERIQGLRRRILAGNFSQGDGGYGIGDLVSHYVDHVERDIAIARTLKVVVDCGNATAALVAPQLYTALGCDLVELDKAQNEGDDGVPDPSRPEYLAALQAAVVTQGADLGLAFDGDADRLGVVDSSGKIIWPDRVLMLLAADVLSRHPGTDVIYDVKSSHHLATEILRNGGHPVMWKSGHAPLKAKLQETGALLAGEWSGHIIFRERWFGFDDAIYSGARLLEVLALDPRPSAEVFAALPEAVGTPELIMPLPEGEAPRIMHAVLAQGSSLEGVDLFTEDGLRVEAKDGWGLVRASHTQPAIAFRFEADDEAGLSSIQGLFRGIMERAAPKLELPF